jgi:hypothetical protein
MNRLALPPTGMRSGRRARIGMCMGMGWWWRTNAADRGPTKFWPWAANRGVGCAVAASMVKSFNARACPWKDFRAVFFLRKFSRNSVAFNVPEACVVSGTPDAKPCAGRVPPPQLRRRKT